MELDPRDPRSTFGPAAERYAASEVHGDRGALGRLVDVLEPGGGRLLDIATGSGHTALAFAPYIDKVIATDLTGDMLKTCRRLARESRYANLEVSYARAESLPFLDDQFDYVTCRLAPHHFEDVGRFVREVARVLKRGGKFLLVDNVGPDDKAAAEELDRLETVRDPSHGHYLQVPEWHRHLDAGGLKLRFEESKRKRMGTQEWMDRIPVSAELQPRLLEWMDGSTGALRDYLEPDRSDGRHTFVLREHLILADK